MITAIIAILIIYLCYAGNQFLECSNKAEAENLQAAWRKQKR